MTIQDANKLLAIAKANYSYAFKGMTNNEKVMLVHSWAFALQDIPADIVLIAFMQLLTVCKWLPTIAEIRERIQKLHYEANEPLLDYFYDPRQEPERVRAARDYIERTTGDLRGDALPMLSLEAILGGQYMPTLGKGEMDLRSLSPAAGQGTNYPEWHRQAMNYAQREYREENFGTDFYENLGQYAEVKAGDPHE